MLAPSQTLLTERRPLEALRDCVEPWRRLAADAAEPNVFYEPGFALAAAPVFGRDVEAILVWSRPRRLVGLFPFRVAARRYGAELPVLIGWTHAFAPSGIPLVDRGSAAAVVESFIDHVAADTSLPKILLLPLLNDSGPVAAALRATVERSGGAHAAFGRHQRAALQPHGDAAHYVERAIGKKRHKEVKRLRRRLAEAGPVVFEVARSPAAVATALQDFLALEAKGWKGAAGTALVQSPELRRFAESAVDALARQGQGTVSRLLLGSRPIACIVTLQSAGGVWCWKIAYDESLARFSPGVQAMTELTEALLADDTVASADSCAAPHHPMIDHLWRERLAMVDLMIGLQPGARFAIACRLESTRRRAIAWARGVRDVVHGVRDLVRRGR
jgi:CelD/BcsL family acetyltransferase involved in cellulose biosynthesis